MTWNGYKWSEKCYSKQLTLAELVLICPSVSVICRVSSLMLPVSLSCSSLSLSLCVGVVLTRHVEPHMFCTTSAHLKHPVVWKPGLLSFKRSTSLFSLVCLLEDTKADLSAHCNCVQWPLTSQQWDTQQQNLNTGVKPDTVELQMCLCGPAVIGSLPTHVSRVTVPNPQSALTSYMYLWDHKASLWSLEPL